MATKKNIRLTTRIHYLAHGRDYAPGVVLDLPASEKKRLKRKGLAVDTTEPPTVFETVEKKSGAAISPGKPRRVITEKSGGKK